MLLARGGAPPRQETGAGATRRPPSARGAPRAGVGWLAKLEVAGHAFHLLRVVVPRVRVAHSIALFEAQLIAGEWSPPIIRLVVRTDRDRAAVVRALAIRRLHAEPTPTRAASEHAVNAAAFVAVAARATPADICRSPNALVRHASAFTPAPSSRAKPEPFHTRVCRRFDSTRAMLDAAIS